MGERTLTQLVFILLFLRTISHAVSLNSNSEIAQSNFSDQIPTTNNLFGDQDLMTSKVIGDVIDMAKPTADLMVQYYGNRQVRNGEELRPQEVVVRPYVAFSVRSPPHHSLFTLVMVDPDAPDPRQPLLREVLHWLVINIPEGMDPSRGMAVVPYLSPMPVSGIHRYAFMLFRQRGPIGIPSPLLQARVRFNTRQFAAQHGLGLPVAAVHFTSHM